MTHRLIKYLPDLLTHFDSVIIPDFGGFIAKSRPTLINSSNNINPPGKSITFNHLLNHNDGLLGNYIAQIENLSYAEAMEIINAEVNDIRSVLNKGEVYKIENLGEFRSVNDHLIFKSYDVQNYSLDSFGLEEVQNFKISEPVIIPEPAASIIEPLKEELKTEEIVEDEIFDKAENIQINIEESKKTTGKFLIPFMLIVIFSLIGFSAYLFKDEIADLSKVESKTDTSSVKIHNQGLQLLGDTLNEQAVNHDHTMDTASNPVIIKKSVPEKAGGAVSSGSNTVVRNKTITSNIAREVYCIAYGSYSNMREASIQKMQLDMTGFDCEIIQIVDGGLYQIVIGEYDNYNTAVDELAFVKSIDKNFYILTVKPISK